jgi:uncharacterized protein (DUF924 family)
VRHAVDLCCGDGWFTPALARLADKTTGLDTDATLLARARARATEQQAPHCRFVNADACALADTLDTSADVVLLANSLHGAPDRTAFLRATAGGMAERGRLAVVNWHRWPRERTPVLGTPRGPRYEIRMTPSDVAVAAGAAGLVVERLVELPPFHYAVVLQRAANGPGADVAALVSVSSLAGPDCWQERLIAFWNALGLEGWFAKDPAFDASFRNRFLPLHQAAARRDLDHWAETPRGALALLILLDQFPRNAIRGTAHILATDALALSFARDFLRRGHDLVLPPELRLFFYLPFTHSEDPADQEVSLQRRRALGPRLERHAAAHVDIIRRFGRFPHRNALLGRATTPAEAAFLAAGGFCG